MKSIFILTLLLFPFLSSANEVVKATCGEGTIIFDRMTGDYSYAEGAAIIYGDEGITEVFEDSTDLFHIKNIDNYLRPPITPDGDWVSPFVTSFTEIKINKDNGQGSVIVNHEGGERKDILNNCY